MSLLDKASLICTPNAVKAGKLYSIVPSSGAGDMDVVRATTATRVNSAGLIENVGLNVARIDYTNGSCPSILVEPQRTNLFTYSNEFSNATWIKNTGAILANIANSPEGITNASKLVGVALTTQQWIYRLNAAVVVGTQYTFSIFAKKGEYNFIQLRNLSNINSNSVFNLNTGTIHSTSTGTAKIQDFGNGWYRCSVSATATATGNSDIYVNLSTNGALQQSFLGDGTSGVFIYGAQYETGSYPTSYIPTVASIQTRNADVISKTGISSLIGQTEGAVFVDLNFNNSTSKTEVNRIIELTDGTNANRIIIAFGSTTAILTRVTSSGSEQASFSATVSLGRLKIALSYSSSGVKLFVNGALIQSNLSTIIPATSRINLGYQGTTGTQQLDDSINSSQLYKTALTDAECITLTTL